jgi:hypothetical protein
MMALKRLWAWWQNWLDELHAEIRPIHDDIEYWDGSHGLDEENP